MPWLFGFSVPRRKQLGRIPSVNLWTPHAPMYVHTKACWAGPPRTVSLPEPFLPIAPAPVLHSRLTQLRRQDASRLAESAAHSVSHSGHCFYLKETRIMLGKELFA